jgi:hypothetical protein
MEHRTRGSSSERDSGREALDTFTRLRESYTLKIDDLNDLKR